MLHLPNRRRFLVVTAAGVVAPLLGGSRVVRAADGLRAKTSVDRTQIRTGEEFVLVLEVEREGEGSIDAPELPSELEENFDVLQCVPRVSTNVNVFNGRGTRTQTRSLRCVLSPRKAGKFEVAFSARDGAKKVRSNTTKFEVHEADTVAVADPSQTSPIDAQGDIFLWASVDQARAYVGEQITYSLEIYEARRFLDPHLRTPPTFQDFFSEELPVAQPRITSVGGTRYRVRPALRRALFPQKAGMLTIGAAEISIGLRRRERSPAIEVEVVPLPAENQPPKFSPNNVGSYDIEAQVDRTQLKTGEPFTLTVAIQGRGNVDIVDPGAWPAIEGARRYDPKVETTRDSSDVIAGRRTYDFLLIPERPGSLRIPAHELSFFDPGAQSYQTVRTKPLELEVSGEAIAAEASEGEDDEEAGLSLAPVIPGETVPRQVPRERFLDATRWLYAMVAVPTLAAVGLGAGAAWRRFGPDEAAVARGQARARRRAQIDVAEATVESGDGFHASVAKLLQDLAVDRAGSEGAGLPRGQLTRLLADQGVDRKDLDALASLLDVCDEARFAAQLGSVDDRRGLLDDALALARRSSLAEGSR